MRSIMQFKTAGAACLKPAVFGLGMFLVSVAMPSLAQTPPKPPPQHEMAGTVDQNKMMADQIAELRAQVASLQAAQQGMTGKNSGSKPAMKMGSGKPMGMGMGMMGDKGEMGGMPPPAGAMKDDQGEMSGMAGMSGGAMPNTAPAAAMGMCCMGGMGGMSGGGRGGMSNNAAPPPGGMPGMNAPMSAMPAQPGASHLYHIGSTGFFLNHVQHITLTQDQTMTLNRIKEKAMLDRASMQRQVDQAEQDLYALTGADQPDASKMQAKIAGIEKLRGDQRMNFIRAVGEASKVLTHEQHLVLVGTMASSKK